MATLQILELLEPYKDYLQTGLMIFGITLLIVFIYTKRRQMTVKMYGRFLDEYYTKQGVDIPIIVARIQNGNIRRYNTCATMLLCRLMFFRPMAEIPTVAAEFSTKDIAVLPIEHTKISKRMIPIIATRTYDVKKEWEQS